MGLLDSNIMPNLMRGAAAFSSQKGNDYYRFQRGVNRNLGRVQNDRRKKQMRDAAKELIGTDLEGMESEERAKALMGIAKKYDAIQPQEFQGLVRSYLVVRDYLNTADFGKKQRAQKETQWGQQNTAFKNSQIDRTAKLGREEKTQEHTKWQREQEKTIAPYKVKRLQADIDRMKQPGTTNAQFNASQKRIKRQVDKLVVGFGIEGTTIKNKMVAVPLERKAELEAALAKVGLKANLVTVENEFGSELVAVHSTGPFDPSTAKPSSGGADEVARLLKAGRGGAKPEVGGAPSEATQGASPQPPKQPDPRKKGRIKFNADGSTDIQDEEVDKTVTLKGGREAAKVRGAYVVKDPETGKWHLAKAKERIEIREMMGVKTLSQRIKENINILPPSPVPRGTNLLDVGRRR